MQQDERSKKDPYHNTRGFTLLELAVAMGVSMVVITAIYMIFTSHQASYAVQTQISATQQNLRAAMYRMTEDIQMAGYYTNFVKEPFTMNWDDLDGDVETIKPVVYGRSNVNAAGIRANTDILILVQADREVSRLLSAGDEIRAGDTATIPGSLRNLTSSAGDELKNGYYGLLVKKDLKRAEFFMASGPEESDFDVALEENYGENDLIYRVDIFYYFIDDSLKLRRKNLSTGANETIAENIENLQIRYRLKDGSVVSELPETSVASVRAVEVSLLGRTNTPIKGYTDNKIYEMAGESYNPPEKNYQRRQLETTILTRNIGL